MREARKVKLSVLGDLVNDSRDMVVGVGILFVHRWLGDVSLPDFLVQRGWAYGQEPP